MSKPAPTSRAKRRKKSRGKATRRASTATPPPPNGLLAVGPIAEIMGVRKGQIRRWIEDGCPVARKGGPGKSALLDPVAVKAWRAERPDPARPGGMSVSEESARLKAADRALKEQQLRKRSGELLERVEWIHAGQEHIVHAKAKLLALPAALAERTCHAAEAGGAAAVQRLWLDAIEDALRELAGIVPDAATT